MNMPARNSLAIVGAGPIGLEAAAAALERGLDVHVFERGEVGAHAMAWGHVRMFTPWRMNIGPRASALLAAHGWQAPAPEEFPTGDELASRLLQPLAETPELKPRIHTHSQVAHISRFGALKGDAAGRRDRPFRLLVRDAGGRENFLHAFAVLDASGTYGSPNCAGTGGVPARNESYLAPQLSYHVDDVRGLRRARYAGKRTMLIGAGASAATSVTALAQLAAEEPGTTVAWVTRRDGSLTGIANDDALPARRALFAEAEALRAGANPAVTWIGGAEVEGLEYNSATHRYRVQLSIAGAARVEEVDQVLVNCGFGPDDSLYRELRVHECFGSRGPMNLSAFLLGAGEDCVAVPAAGIDVLRNPEPDFYILGAKSYGRLNSFLLETGYRSVAEVVDQLAKDMSAAVTG